jgi:hypothetical protein
MCSFSKVNQRGALEMEIFVQEGKPELCFQEG